MTVRNLCVGIWLVALIAVTTILFGVVAQRGLLIWAAPIMIALPIFGLRWLKPREELAGWSLYTVWLGSTYLQSGVSLEYFAFAVLVALALLGFFRSPWFLVIAWFGHIPWDFIPRELPPLLEQLPVACLIFDGLIGAFIAWQLNRGRWQAGSD